MIYCLVQGDKVKHSFPIDIKDDTTVGHLKNAIKKEKKSIFDNIDANNLTLWKVDITQTKENQEMKIEEHKGIELFPFENIGTIFQGNSNNIRIIVESPQPTTIGKCLPMFYHLSNEKIDYIDYISFLCP
jgi:hypothetical protein